MTTISAPNVAPSVLSLSISFWVGFVPVCHHYDVAFQELCILLSRNLYFPEPFRVVGEEQDMSAVYHSCLLQASPILHVLPLQMKSIQCSCQDVAVFLESSNNDMSDAIQEAWF